MAPSIARELIGECHPIRVRIVLLQSRETKDEIDIVKWKEVCRYRFDWKIADFDVDGIVAVYCDHFSVGDSDFPRANLSDGGAESLDEFVIDIEGGRAGVDNALSNVSVAEVATVGWETRRCKIRQFDCFRPIR
jgi:hypothetical protein